MCSLVEQGNDLSPIVPRLDDGLEERPNRLSSKHGPGKVNHRASDQYVLAGGLPQATEATGVTGVKVTRPVAASRCHESVNP
eukprot:12257057-Alexandrium_andersonii.AAC.1